jgi:hypothetical protein
MFDTERFAHEWCQAVRTVWADKVATPTVATETAP